MLASLLPGLREVRAPLAAATAGLSPCGSLSAGPPSAGACHWSVPGPADLGRGGKPALFAAATLVRLPDRGFVSLGLTHAVDRT